MFDLIDRDKNGYISFKEFLEMLVTFAKGTAEGQNINSPYCGIMSINSNNSRLKNFSMQKKHG